MSGGSYNYLYSANTVAGLSYKLSELMEMISRLKELGYNDAAEESEKLYKLLSAELPEGLRDLWHAVEWRDSCDWSEDRVEAEYVRYQEGCKNGCQ